jgi:hypothetical protein
VRKLSRRVCKVQVGVRLTVTECFTKDGVYLLRLSQGSFTSGAFPRKPPAVKLLSETSSLPSLSELVSLPSGSFTSGAF